MAPNMTFDRDSDTQTKEKTLTTSKAKLLQVMTCEEKARESSVCPKQGVCHPRLESVGISLGIFLFFSMEMIICALNDNDTQLL